MGTTSPDPEFIAQHSAVIVVACFVIVIDLALSIKVFAFFPDNLWLLRNGPKILIHLRHEESTDVDAAESYGIRCIDFCKEHVKPRPRLSLRYSREHAGIPGKALFQSMRGPLVGAVNFLFWTPFVVVVSSVTLVLAAPVIPRLLLLLGTVGIGLLGFLTLMAAPIIRLSLGAYDIHYSDLSRYVAFFSRRALSRGSTVEALLAYFMGLVMISVTCNAVAYYGIYILYPDAFSGRVSGGFLTWLYYSVSTSSTVGGSGIYAVAAVSRLVVMAQTLTGLLLLFWVAGVVASGGRQGR